MNKTQSGGLLIGIAVLLNIVGRLMLAATRASQNVVIAGLLAILMLASVVIGLFGLFRLISGLLNRKS